MKLKSVLILGFFSFALLGAFLFSGCCKKIESEPRPEAGPAEKAGAAVDKAVDRAESATKKFIDKTSADVKGAASKAAEQTGAALEKAGAAIEKSGKDLQDNNNTGTNP